MTDIDILSIHSKILDNFRTEEEQLELYIDRLSQLKQTKELDNFSERTLNSLNNSIKTLVKKIQLIQTKELENYYIIDATPYITKYEEILNTPIKLSFMGKQTFDDNEKQDIITKYLIIASNYIEVDLNLNEHNKEDIKHTCNNCDNKCDFNVSDNNFICSDCGAQQEFLSHTSSYNDVDRANISVKYTYDRKIHFRDCINQYQGTQNCTIDQKVYDNLEDQFDRHHLLVGDQDTDKEIRFSRITKDHIDIFLKELGYTKHYENINLIHYKMTGNKPDNISHLENNLLDDFDRLTELYDKIYKQEKKIERKNFIHTQYVLFQLLKRHKHPCRIKDFHMLKTTERRYFHDNICEHLFSILGWNFYPSV